MQWIDDNNCLAVFKEPAKLARALLHLRGGQFKVKPYSELSAQAAASPNLPAPRPIVGGWASLTAAAGPKKPRTPPAYVPPEDPISRAPNRYAALDSNARSSWSSSNDASSSAGQPVQQRPEDIPEDWSLLATSTDSVSQASSSTFAEPEPLVK